MLSKYLADGVLASFALATQVNFATVYSKVLPEINFDGPDSGNSSEQYIGTFSFAVPEGEAVVSTTLNVRFGKRTIPHTAAVKLYVDHVYIGECAYLASCWTGETCEPFNFSIANPDGLSDGVMELTVVQTSEFVTRLGETQIVVETEVIEVPAITAFTDWNWGREPFRFSAELSGNQITVDVPISLTGDVSSFRNDGLETVHNDALEFCWSQATVTDSSTGDVYTLDFNASFNTSGSPITRLK